MENLLLKVWFDSDFFGQTLYFNRVITNILLELHLNYIQGLSVSLPKSLGSIICIYNTQPILDNINLLLIFNIHLMD